MDGSRPDGRGPAGSCRRSAGGGGPSRVGRSGAQMSWLLAAPWILVLLLILSRYLVPGPRLRDYAPLTSGGGPLVSGIIPARNEARNVERCVRSALATTYSPIQVIVGADRSTDGTPGILPMPVGHAGALC